MLDFVTWDVSPFLYNGFIQIRWYSLAFMIGFIIGYEIESRIYKHEGAPERWLSILLMWTVAGTIIGARLGHVFFYEWDVYSQDPIKILYVWQGGLASHGGTIGIIIGVLCYSIFTTKRNPIWTFDRLVIPIALVGGLIRLGNLMNSEIFGHATDLPWGFMFVRSREWQEMYYGQACHPTQIYEALCYFALFALLMWMYWKRNAERRPGLIFGVFFLGIFVPRFLIEFIKNDQVAFEAGMTLNMGQWLSVPFILAGIGLIIYALVNKPVTLEFPNQFAEELAQNRRHQRRN
ncbi:MAG: prolipoprotein diacylglyceryl transferase [Lachnoclostridium sp.]|nr:prolipoprotein diacylglyceryl transferase [Lachnoclostridium sp.]